MEKIIDKKISEKKNIWCLFMYIYYGLLNYIFLSFYSI